MPGKCRPSLRDKTLENVMRSSLSSTDKECIKAVFERYEAEPVKHGRWIEAAAYNDGVLNTAYCSVCRTFLPVRNWDYHNYCPTCGAKMDGGDEG